jgi:hypothetical protein
MLAAIVSPGISCRRFQSPLFRRNVSERRTVEALIAGVGKYEYSAFTCWHRR